MIKRVIAEHLQSLIRFSGRERREMFWTWVAIVVAAFLTCWMVAFGVAVASVGSGSPAAVFTILPLVMIGLATIVVLLLAAAVTRRLHDAGRAGWWGIATPFLLFGGLTMMAWVFTHLPTDGHGEVPPLFGVIMINNLLYLSSLVMLVILCCGASQRGPNRYGPAPEEEAR